MFHQVKSLINEHKKHRNRSMRRGVNRHSFGSRATLEVELCSRKTCLTDGAPYLRIYHVSLGCYSLVVDAT